MNGKSGWKNGKDMKHLQARLRLRAEFVKAQGLRALELSVDEGAIALQDNLEAAHTRTGERRAERGGFPGRHKSGNMVGSIGSTGDKPVKQGKSTFWASFGWFAKDFEVYMRDQDLGEGDIPAARALPDAFTYAREQFRRRMQRVVKGKPID